MVLIGLLAVSVTGQASSPNVTAAPSAASYLDAGKWTYPSLDDVLATEFDVYANVVIDCGVTKSGHMSDCYVGESDGSAVKVRDRKVGAAYLALASVDHPASIGGVQDGDRVQFHYNWADLPHPDLQGAASLPSVAPEQTSRYAHSKWKIPMDASEFDDSHLMNRVNGAVEVDCMIGADGKMTTCSVFGEAPKGNGLGKMAAKGFLKYTSVDPTSVLGGIQPGDHRLFKLNFFAN